MMMPFDSACSQPRRKISSVSAFSRDVSSRPMIFAASSSLMLTSWPLSSFVAGVKIGSGSRSDSYSPFGRAMPQTMPVFWYSFHPDPDR